MRYGRTCRHPRRSPLFQSRIKIRDKRENFCLRRLRCFPGGHFAAVELIERLGPVMAIDAGLEIARELINSQIPFFILGSMTAEAIVFEENFKRFGSAHNTSTRTRTRTRTSKSKAGDQQ